MTSTSKLIVNLTRENVVCERAGIADRPLTRMRGLLGRRSLPAGEGLLLQPAPSIHTGFMRFPIDAVFLDRDFRVVKLVEDLRPWRTTSQRRARSVLELPAGEARRRGVELGDQLTVVEADPSSYALEAIARDTSSLNAVISDAFLSRDLDTDLESSTRPGRPLATLDPAGPEGVASQPDATRVLVVSPDRRFRAVTGALLTRRGCAVTLDERIVNVVDLAKRECADVVVLDTRGSLTAAARQAAEIEILDPPVGIVLVADEDQQSLSAMPVLPKWGSFAGLYSAIERARPVRIWGASNA